MNGADLSFEGLNIHKIRFDTKDVTDRKTCKQMIAKIVPTASSDDSERYQYKKAADWDSDAHLGFHVRLYYLKHPTRSSFAKWMAATTASPPNELTGSIVHIVCFLFRQLKIQESSESANQQWEVFALTQGDGWRVVKHDADFRFPLRVAAKLVKPKFSFVDSKPLVGDKHSSQETYRRDYSLEQHEHDSMWQIFNVFRSSFKEGTSLYNPEYQLSAFNVSKVTRKRAKKAVKIGSGKIGIAGKMTFKQHVEILDHLSRVYRGESYRIDEEGKRILEEDDLSWRYLENIRRVKQSLVPKLSQALLVMLWQCYEQKKCKSQLSFVHRYYKDFYASSEFILSVSGKRYSWSYPPLIEEVLECFRYLAGPFSKVEEFCQKVTNARFSFSRQKKSFALNEFFQGEIRYKGSAYFHVDGTWLEVDKNHLAVIQRSFRALLQKHLIDGTKSSECALTKPWFANHRWVAFRFDEMKETTGANDDELTQILEELSKIEFSFIDEEGHVICPYPTHCLLQESDAVCRSIKPILRKNWESLELILREKSGQVISEEDVAVLFRKKEKPPEDVENEQPTEKEKPSEGGVKAKKLLEILKQKRAVLVKRMPFEARKSAVANIESAFDENGVPVMHDLSTYTFKLETIKKHKAIIEKFLKEMQETGKTVSAKNLREKINTQKNVRNIALKDAEAVMKALKALPKPSQQQADPHLYSIQGPIPEGFDCKNEKVLAFLQKKHRNYRRILQEEGYNRLYLEKDGFLIFDQVYPGAGEKVELFDILQYDITNPQGNLYLYHVKEGFGQKTREACSQIRVSAGLLRNAIDRKSQTLHRLYDQAMSEDATSPFRKKLKEKLEKLGSATELEEKPSNRFVSIFTEARKIWYVYAFIDDAETERRLEAEQNPTLKLCSDDLSALIPAAERRSMILAHLKDQHLLDGDHRLTDDFFRLTKEQFNDKMKDFEEKDLIFSCINGKVSQFDSLIAKVELLHLRNFLKDLNFGFKIYQISRRDKQSPHQGVGQANESYEFTQEDWDGIVLDNQFEYNGKKHIYSEKKYTFKEVIKHILNINSETYFNLKLFKLFQENQEKLSTGSEDVKKYLLSLLHVAFSFGEAELINTAICLDYKIIIFNEDYSVSKTLNENGQKEFLILKNKKTFRTVRTNENDSESDPQIPTQVLLSAGNTDFPYSEVLSGDLQDEILLRSCPSRVGMINDWSKGGNDCFFNAVFQLIIHSPLQEFFLNQDNLEENEDGSPKDCSMRFLDFFKELSLAYHHSREGADKATRYSRSEMRNLLSFPSEGQQDADETITKILGFYRLAEMASTISYTTKWYNPQPVTSTSIDENVVPGLEFAAALLEPHVITKTELLPFIEISPIKDESFQITFESQILQVETLEETQNKPIEIDGILCQASHVERHKEITELKDNIYFRIKRYEPRRKADGTLVLDKEGQTVIDKLDKSLTLDNFEIKIGESDFELQGFIYHSGPSVNSGHYTTYCRTENGWTHYNDVTVKELKNEQPSELEEVKLKAQKAYILHFKRKEAASV